ncbi:unnamed protein product [Coffea canephora]|uniref:Uncharacterized protein n=2 Tax=Coffea TaxID=13442 RepID=A0A068UUE6_COFCA|nr:unnamed protein product [Coffea canephora]
MYKNVTDYSRNYFEYVQQGRMPIDAMKL